MEEGNQCEPMANGEHPTRANGKICHIEISAADINASATFYKEVFGWRVRQRGDGAVAFDETVNEVSGTWVPGRSAAAQPGFLIYIMVDSVAAAVDAVVKNEGVISILRFEKQGLRSLFSPRR